MRIAVFSDIHGNLDALLAVLQDAHSQGCTKLFCCGDVVGYGGNPNECCKLLRERNIPTVLGNHDEAVASDEPLPFGTFNPIAATSVYWSREYTTVSNREWLRKLPFTHVDNDLGIMFCHSSPLEPGDWSYLTSPIAAAPVLARMEVSTCFIGHSHEPAVFWREQDGHVMMVPPCTVRLRPDERYLINAGSVGQPRDNDCRASYFIFDHTDGVIFPRRVRYPVHVAQQKIRSAGLPERLAERLALGR